MTLSFSSKKEGEDGRFESALKIKKGEITQWFIDGSFDAIVSIFSLLKSLTCLIFSWIIAVKTLIFVVYDDSSCIMEVITYCELSYHLNCLMPKFAKPRLLSAWTFKIGTETAQTGIWNYSNVKKDPFETNLLQWWSHHLYWKFNQLIRLQASSISWISGTWILWSRRIIGFLKSINVTPGSLSRYCWNFVSYPLQKWGSESVPLDCSLDFIFGTLESVTSYWGKF